jgi:hypothetical protein
MTSVGRTYEQEKKLGFRPSITVPAAHGANHPIGYFLQDSSPQICVQRGRDRDAAQIISLRRRSRPAKQPHFAFHRVRKRFLIPTRCRPPNCHRESRCTGDRWVNLTLVLVESTFAVNVDRADRLSHRRTPSRIFEQTPQSPEAAEELAERNSHNLPRLIDRDSPVWANGRELQKMEATARLSPFRNAACR